MDYPIWGVTEGGGAASIGAVTHRRMHRRTRHTLRIVHLHPSLGWPGAAISQLGTGFMVLNSDDVALRHHIFELGSAAGLVVCAPLATIAAVTGILLGAWTEWGLLRSRWVTVKLVVTVALIVFGSTVLGGLSERVATDTVGTTDPTAGIASARISLIAGCGAPLLLVALTVISVVTAWGRRAAGRPPATVESRQPAERDLAPVGAGRS